MTVEIIRWPLPRSLDKGVEQQRQDYARELEQCRTHVLDWQKRMDAYAFTEPPAGVVPKKKTRRTRCVLRCQVRVSVLRAPAHERVVRATVNAHLHKISSKEKLERLFIR